MLRSGWNKWLEQKYSCCLQQNHAFIAYVSNIKQQIRQSSNEISHSSTKRKGRSVFLLLPVTAFCLGTWQVYRYQWKVGIMEEVERKSHLPPVVLESSVMQSLQIGKDREDMGVLTQQDLSYRTVQSSGRYLYGQEILIGPRHYQSQNGFHVVTPFQTREGNKILVNRGWIPAALKDPLSRTQYEVTDNVTLKGMLRKSTPKATFVPENEPDKGLWFWIDIPAIAKHTKSVPLLVDLSSDNTSQPLPIAAPIKYDMLHPRDHLGYAATWYSLALGLAVMSRLFLRKG